MNTVKTFHDVNLLEITELHEKWWCGELGRPIFHCVVHPPSPVLTGSGYAPKNFLPCNPRNMPAAEILDGKLEQLKSERYLGEGFPLFWMNFGPGVLAAMVGGCGCAQKETVWFTPGKWEGVPLEKISIQFDPDADWAKWIAELYQTATEKFENLPVVLGMTDLGGVLDVLASLRGTQELLMDLLDAPDEIKRLLKEEREAWFTAYDYFHALRKGPSSCWAAILGENPTYMLQSDFAYMISPDMFAEFVQPELQKYVNKLDHAFYHLDGKNQIPHIPHLAAIDGLDGIQWIPGAGQPPQSEWPDVLHAIEDHGLKVQLIGNLTNVKNALSLLKHPENAHVWMGISENEIEDAQRFMAEYGLD